MVYRKKRGSRIKSKRSRTGYKRSRTKRSRTKSKLKRSRRGGSRVKRSIHRGGSTELKYTNMDNSSPILDSIIKSIDDINTILDFIKDIKGGNRHNLLCQIGQIVDCSSNDIYEQIFKKIMTYENIFKSMNLFNITESSVDRYNILYKFLNSFIRQLLQFELLVFLTKKPNYVINLLTSPPHYKIIIEKINLLDIEIFCKKFKLPPNTSYDKIKTIILDTPEQNLNLFEYLEKINVKCKDYESKKEAPDNHDSIPGELDFGASSVKAHIDADLVHMCEEGVITE
jgi:hypothetical protein